MHDMNESFNPIINPITLVSERDWDKLMELIDNPPPPNEALLEAARRYKELCPDNCQELQDDLRKI